MTASKELNIAALAFIGDAVYEVYVRKHVMETGVAHSDVLHKMASLAVKFQSDSWTSSGADGTEFLRQTLTAARTASNVIAPMDTSVMTTEDE